MSIGTVPQRWKELSKGVPSAILHARKERSERTNVCILDYQTDVVQETSVFSAHELRKELDMDLKESKALFRLYVVEDLSRDVIEVLGQKRMLIHSV